MKKTLTLAVALVAAVFAGQAQAGVLTNGSLTVTFNDGVGGNGSIQSVMFGGTEFFERGTNVSNFAIQNGTTTSTFAINGAEGESDIPVTVVGSTVSGTYTEGGANLSFARTYSLVPGLDVLRISTVYTNLGGSDITLSQADTYDPDQGLDLGHGFDTFNDVFGLAGGTVGQARIDSGGDTHTVVIGSVDGRETVASGSPFSISSGSGLNSFFTSPFDGNDSFADSGTHVGIRTLLAAGASTTFVSDLAFGLSPTEAQDAFVEAQVPEPASIAIFGVSALGLVAGGIRRRKRQKAAC